MYDLRRMRLPVLFPSLERHGLSLWLLVFFFLAGVLAGALPGRDFPLFPDVPALMDSAGSSGVVPGYLLNLLSVSWPSLCALFLAGSAVGFLLIPLLFALRGCMISTSICVLLSGGVFGFGQILFLVGLPAFFSAGAMFLLGEDALSSSFALYRICVGFPRGRYTFVSSDRLVFAAVLLTTAALIRQFVIPLLLYT